MHPTEPLDTTTLFEIEKPSWSFETVVASHGLRITPRQVHTLQINVTKLCNQACRHCHVDASPKRREFMSAEAIDRCLEILAASPSIRTLDITGGAPELHSGFAALVKAARSLGKDVMVRHNLTVTLDPHPMTKEPMDYLPDFFREHQVILVSSLPYYQEFFTDKQRGKGVFGKSIESLKRLNSVGYGIAGSGLTLNLVYNPVGSFLPAPQAELEKKFKHELFDLFGIVFNDLYTITNMPIHRFREDLERRGTYEEYMERLVEAFNPHAALGVMCRDLISVSHDGKLYDCDFNQMLEMDLGEHTIWNFDLRQLESRTIRFDSHCFGCTAGSGSSCGGATA